MKIRLYPPPRVTRPTRSLDLLAYDHVYPRQPLRGELRDKSKTTGFEYGGCEVNEAAIAHEQLGLQKHYVESYIQQHIPS